MTEPTLPAVSIIIVNWNGRALLEVCLRSLQALDYPADRLEIILVDNASSDGSVEYVRSAFPSTKILCLDANYGFCRPNNEGAKAASGEYLVLLNNDTEVTPRWLRELVEPALQDRDIVICASKMLYYDHRDTINTAGGKLTIIGGGFYRGYGDMDGTKYDAPGPTGFACAAGLLVRRDFFLGSGGFDEDYFAACEEHDLSWRAWLYGYRVAYASKAVMYHRESGTFASRSNADPQKVYLNTRNRLFNLIKNLDWWNITRGKLISACFNFYRWCSYLMTGNARAAGAVCRAYFDFALSSGRLLRKRKSVQAGRKRSDAELYRLGVIAGFWESLSEERRLSSSTEKFYSAGKRL